MSNVYNAGEDIYIYIYLYIYIYIYIHIFETNIVRKLL